MLEMDVAYHAPEVRTPEIIAYEINTIVSDTMRTVLYNSIEVGRKLCEVKEMIPRGQWGQWLKDNVDYSERKAQDMMALFEEYGKKGIPAGIENASMTNALQLIPLPDDMRRGLIASGEAESLSSRDLKARIEELQRERDEAQMTIEALMESQQRAEDEADRARAEANAMEEQLDLDAATRNALRIELERARRDADREARNAAELRESALAAQRAAIEASNKLEEARRQAPAVVVQEKEVVPEAVRKELEALRAAAANNDSEYMILFRAAYTRLNSQVMEMVQILDNIREFDGEDVYRTLLEQLRGTGRTIAGLE